MKLKKKADFIGKQALSVHKKEGTPRKLVGFFVDDRGIARHEDKVFLPDDRPIGVVTSGTKTPTLGKALGLALIESEFSQDGQEIYAEVRGRKLRCAVQAIPFYKRS